jgi:hypothetical protein
MTRGVKQLHSCEAATPPIALISQDDPDLQGVISRYRGSRSGNRPTARANRERSLGAVSSRPIRPKEAERSHERRKIPTGVETADAGAESLRELGISVDQGPSRCHVNGQR